MATKTRTYYLAIPRDQIRESTMGVSALMDMLRYDRSTVEEERWGCYILAANHPHTVDRWRSFGIVPATTGLDNTLADLEWAIRQSPLVTLVS